MIVCMSSCKRTTICVLMHVQSVYITMNIMYVVHVLNTEY